MPLLNVDQASDRLGTSPRFIRRLIASAGSRIRSSASTCASTRRTLMRSSPLD